jgi:peptide chain release factor 1
VYVCVCISYRDVVASSSFTLSTDDASDRLVALFPSRSNTPEHHPCCRPYSSAAGSLISESIQRRLDKICERHANLVQQLVDSIETLTTVQLNEVNKEVAEIEGIVSRVQMLRQLRGELHDLKELKDNPSEDEDIRKMADQESSALSIKVQEAEQELLGSLIPEDDADSRSVILEVRAGAGGEEASLFAGELFRMYERYTALKGWKFEVVEYMNSELGGCKLASAAVTGREGVFGRLKFERGVHRVQRVPATESGGRVHTSAASVTVLPQAQEMEVSIKDEDLRIDVYRSGGAGGQHVNTTNSAVRITHLPSGISVAIQDERSQHKNKAKALKVLRARLYDIEKRRSAEAQSSARRQQIGSGDRSERVRTYNYSQGRVTDHRVGITEHGIESIMGGEGLDIFIDALRLQHQSELLANLDIT